MAKSRGTVRRDGLTIDYDCEHCYTEVDNCAIQIWRGTVLKPHISVMRARWEALIERKGTFALIVIVLPSAPPPSNERRREIGNIYVDLADQIEAIASVFQGQGLKGSTASIVMSTMMLLAKSAYPTKNTTSISAAAEWLDSTVKSISADRLKRAVDDTLKIYEDICGREFNESLAPSREEIRKRAANN